VVEYFGRRLIGAAGAFGLAADGQERAVVFAPTGVDLWMNKFGIRTGKFTGTNAAVVLCCRRVDDDYRPSTLIGYSDVVTASTTMTTGAGGVVVTPAVDVGLNNPRGLAIMLGGGNTHALSILADLASAGFGMEEAANVNYQDEHFYTASGRVGTTPPDAFGAYATTFEGMINIWGECELNVKPLTPASRSPGSTNQLTPTVVATNTPVLTGSFRDLNGVYGPGNGGVNVGDCLNRVWITVRRASDDLLLWEKKYTASDAEVAAEAFSITYAGSTLTNDTLVYWTCAVSDQFNRFSDTSDKLYFKYSSAGFVTLDGTPTGKTDDVDPNFQFRWNHGSGTATTHTRLTLFQGDTIVDQHEQAQVVASSAFPGTLATFNWPFGTDVLAAGKKYWYQVEASTNGGTSWFGSAKRSFTVDASPSIPRNPSPQSGTIGAGLPAIRFTMSDVDDTVGTGLTCVLEISSSPNIDNIEFVSDVAGWVNHAAVTNITATGPTYQAGQNGPESTGGALQVVISANTNGGTNVGPLYRTTERYGCVTGETYSATMWGRTTNANLKPLIAIMWYDASDVLLSTSVDTSAAFPMTANVWAEKDSPSFSAVAPASAVWMRLAFRATSVTANQTGTVYVDGIQFDGLSMRRRKTMSLVAGTTDRWEYQVTSDDYTEIDTYHHKAYGYDGYLYSGGVLTQALATRSANMSYQYVTGMTVTITSPTEGEHITSGHLMTFTISSGTVSLIDPDSAYKIHVWDADIDEQVFSSNGGDWTKYGAQPIAFPNFALPYTGNFYMILEVRNDAGVEGISAVRNFVVDPSGYSPPTYSAIGVSVGGAPFDVAIQHTWGAPSFLGTSFGFLEIRRNDLADPIFVTYSDADRVFIDATAQHGVEYTYTLRYYVYDIFGLGQFTNSTQQIVTLNMTGAAFVDPAAAGLRAFAVSLLTDFDGAALQVAAKTYTPPGGAAPVTVARVGLAETYTVKFTLTTEPGVASLSAVEKYRMWKDFAANAGPLLTYRDHLGTLIYCTITGYTYKHVEQDVIEVSVNLRQERHTPQVTI
jgi:hypothetical protein